MYVPMRAFPQKAAHLTMFWAISPGCLSPDFSEECLPPQNNPGRIKMRISEDRYRRERHSLQLALRFLEHEARTQTIRRWTGLSDDRIRKLYRSYATHAPRFVRRHRGKSPHQVAYFGRSLRIQQETVWLASLLSLFGVIPPEPCVNEGSALPNVPRGELLCQ